MPKRPIPFAVALAVLLGAAVPCHAGVAGKLLGSWEMMNIQRGGIRYEIVMTIEQDRVRMTSRCSHQGNEVEVVVSSAAKITDGQLDITESDRDEKEYSPGYLMCRAAIKPMQVNYALEDGKLVLSDPQRPQPMVLSRITP